MTVNRLTPEEHLRAGAAVARAALVAWHDGREGDAARIARIAANRATDAADDLAAWRHALTVVEAGEVIGTTPRTTARLVTEGDSTSSRRAVTAGSSPGPLTPTGTPDSARRRAALTRA